MKKTSLIASVTLFMSATVSAEHIFSPSSNTESTAINYDFIQADVSFGSDLTDFGISGEYRLNNHIILGGNVNFINGDDDFVDFSLGGLTGEVLYRLAATDVSDFVFGGHLGYGWMDTKVMGISFDDNSMLVGAQAGYRHAIGDQFEFGGSLVLANAYSNTELLFKANALYNINSDFGVGAILATGNELGHTETMFGIQGRYSF